MTNNNVRQNLFFVYFIYSCYPYIFAVILIISPSFKSESEISFSPFAVIIYIFDEDESFIVFVSFVSPWLSVWFYALAGVSSPPAGFSLGLPSFLNSYCFYVLHTCYGYIVSVHCEKLLAQNECYVKGIGTASVFKQKNKLIPLTNLI